MMNRPTDPAMIRRALIAALLLATAAAAGAADTDAPAWYDVEVLVFKNNAPADGGEIWPADPGHPDLEKAVELVPVPQANPLPGSPQPFQQLDETAFTLKTAATRLTGSPNYKPLLHLAWLQPAGAQTDAPAVHIHTDGSRDAAGTEDARTLDGSIRLSRSRFLHVDVDLVYHDAGVRSSASGSGSDEPPTLFRLQQSRRVNSGELHYFDNPVFGLLVKVTPHETGQKDGRGKAR
jgi:hypothetical protein